MTDSNDLFPRALSFMLGKLYIAVQVHEALEKSGPSVVTLLERHARGDWGAVTPELRERNQRAVLNGFRIKSYYRTLDGTVIAIRTNAARTETHCDVEDDEAEGLL
jgi:hypothetical protein